MQVNDQYYFGDTRGETMIRLQVANRVLVVFAILLSCFCMNPQNATAQNYETLKIGEQYYVPVLTGRETKDEAAKLKAKVTESKAKIRDDGALVLELLKSNAATSDTFDSFFRDYLFAEMAQTEDSYLSNLAAKREEFHKRYLSADFTGNNRAHVIERLLLPTMKQVAEGNFHPAARLNAILMIGMANSVEGNTLSSEPPTPNAACVKYLLSAMNQESLPVFVKVGAFTGLHRVAQIESVRPKVDANDVKQIQSFSLAISEGKFAGQDQWSKDVDYWLRRRAVQMLGFFHEPGPAGEVVTALLAIVDDKANEFLLRLDAIQSLGQLNYPNAQSANVQRISESVATFTSEALLNQADQIRADVDEFVAINLLNGGDFLFRKGVEKGGGGKGNNMKAGTGGLDGGDAPSGQDSAKGADGPIFDMPNYYLNLQRRTCKNYAVVCQGTFSRTGKIYSLGTDAERILLDETLKILEDVLVKSDVGLVDQSKLDTKGKDETREKVGTAEADKKKKPVVWELIKLFSDSGEKVKTLLAAQKKNEAAQGAPPPAGQ